MAQPVIASVSKFENDNNASTTMTLNVPSGTVDDDVLIAVCMNDGSTATTEWQAETGWTLDRTGGSSASDCHIGIYTRKAASEPASYTFDSSSSVRRCGIMMRITGADADDITDVAGTVTLLSSGTSAQGSSVTTSETDALVLAFCGWDGGDTLSFSTSNTDWTFYDELRSDNSATSACLGIFTKDDTSTAGATGNLFMTSTKSDGNLGVQFAINAGAGGGGGAVFTPIVMQY